MSGKEQISRKINVASIMFACHSGNARWRWSFYLHYENWPLLGEMIKIVLHRLLPDQVLILFHVSFLANLGCYGNR